MLSTKNERTALLISTVLFALFGIAQLWRFFTDTVITFGGRTIPTWPSLLVGLVTIAMAVWLGALVRRRRTVS